MKCGLGNWFDISEQYVKSKNATSCEIHYFAFYYKNKTENIPSEVNDCIIHGQREIIRKNNGDAEIVIPIDKEKAEKNKIRI
jgi:hypothetical protein